MRRVITIGASTVDCLMKSKALKMLKSHEMPGGVAMCEVLGGKIEAEDGVLVTGGGATNVAVGLRRLGHSVKILSRVGDDLLSKMILQVHDELIFETVIPELEQLKEIVIHEMSNAVELSVPLKVDWGTGKNWLEAH